MPPAKKRTRSYDSAKIRAAVLAQFGNVREAVVGLTAEQLALPTALGDWTVRELVSHLALAIESVNRTIELSAELSTQQPVTTSIPTASTPVLPLLRWPFVTADLAPDISRDVKAVAASASPDELFERTAGRIAALLPATPDDRVITTRVGAMRLGDFLVTRTIELIVHTDDLNRAVAGLGVPYDRQALAACTRLLADALAVKAPGASTEVRIPPYAVVQCVEGPRHTRGTPPNVVETDPLTWIRLATGRTTWREALQAAHVSASGERADLGGLLPLMR
ncbi:MULTISPECIES: maleylpyruvate isomerase family mycothiol-dependent enzyme [unclassified Streptomyces]|uniref:maleylpyruvate isomerase family mycothiol-dependent enzyme n=1 Tax=unclassified Streptomyces TaxID=2593676 RepID=UPI00081E6BFC|nr:MULTISPECIES: maleylpyruvate isomerase family mycothiol-dependent enzyme [unclassified Streptomyces]MYZ38509.1 maleylpyruvate isomerase family mycothiol-dependent enzyme [Streptomyces sp. SID4917]SCF98938.1 TIGR03083 family protein [Streptomyces sp. MnatMP-M17]